MKKISILLMAVLLTLTALAAPAALKISAEEETASKESISPDTESDNSFNPDDFVITAGQLEELKEQLKKEILAELGDISGDVEGNGYYDVTLKEGQMIILSPDSEVIFRGGNAVAITSACTQGEGIKDLSENCEIFSGEALKGGHIYLPGESFAKKAILITGSSAYFTLRGSYEIV